MLTSAKKLRLAGHGSRLRVRTHGDWSDALAGVGECCRASFALDKALAESIGRARSAGRSWAEIGKALGAAENAQTWAEKLEVNSRIELARVASHHDQRASDQREIAD